MIIYIEEPSDIDSYIRLGQPSAGCLKLAYFLFLSQ